MAAGELRLICARLGDPDTTYLEENLPMVRLCSRCGHRVIATKVSLEQIGRHGLPFQIICLPCHQADRGAKVVFNSEGRCLGYVPEQPE